MAVNFDTHATVKELTQAGFSEAQAEALVRAVAGQRHDLATKADIATLRADIDTLRAITQADIDALRAATKADLNLAVDPLKTELRLHRWVLGLLVGLQLATLGLLFNVIRLL